MKPLASCIVLLLVTGCPGPASSGDDQHTPDAAVDGAAHLDAPVAGCPLAMTMTDAGMIAAFKAQRCNVPGSGGTQKWYRLSAQLTTTGDYVQLELWPNLGAFTGAVTTGTFTIGGNDAAYTTCGVCGRALGDKGQAAQKEYFATSGTVNVTAVGAAGQPIAATLTNIGFVEVNGTTHDPIASGCAAALAGIQISGTVVDVGGGGGGGGSCPTTVGD